MKPLRERIARKIAKIAYPHNSWPNEFSEASRQAFFGSARQIITMVRGRRRDSREP